MLCCCTDMNQKSRCAYNRPHSPCGPNIPLNANSESCCMIKIMTFGLVFVSDIWVLFSSCILDFCVLIIFFLQTTLAHIAGRDNVTIMQDGASVLVQQLKNKLQKKENTKYDACRSLNKTWLAKIIFCQFSLTIWTLVEAWYFTVFIKIHWTQEQHQWALTCSQSILRKNVCDLISVKPVWTWQPSRSLGSCWDQDSWSGK